MFIGFIEYVPNRVDDVGTVGIDNQVFGFVTMADRRDADYAAMTWYPAEPRLDRWLELYRQVARANGAEPDAGRIRRDLEAFRERLRELGEQQRDLLDPRRSRVEHVTAENQPAEDRRQDYQRDAGGKLLLDPSMVLETWWIAVNPATDVSGLQHCLDELLAMAPAGRPL